MPKQSVRDRMLKQRRQCDAALCRERSSAIQRRLLELPAFARAKCLALYSPVHNEVDTGLVARQALAQGKVVAYPRVEGDHLLFVKTADPALLEPGCFNVPEPTGGASVPPGEIDLCVVPGVAFDRTGHRLGYGRGYYDRFLVRTDGGMLRVGFSYDFQVVEALPASGHDQQLSLLITEERVLDFTD